MVGIDFLQVPRSTQGCAYILVFVDHFSRFLLLGPLRNNSALIVAHAILSHLIFYYTTRRVTSVTMTRSSRIRFLLTYTPNTISSRLSSLHTFLLLPALLNVLTGKHLRSYGTLQDTYTKPEKIGFRILMVQSILQQAKSLTTSLPYDVLF